jgi:hypothetical protein
MSFHNNPFEEAYSELWESRFGLNENLELLSKKIKSGRATPADYVEYARLSKARKEKESGSEEIKSRVEKEKEAKKGLASKERERRTRERGEELLHDIQAREKAKQEKESKSEPEEKHEKEVPVSSPRKLATGQRKDTLASRASAVIRDLQKEGYMSDWRSELFEESDEDPCWKGYEQIGMKKKRGKEVPNCVPKKKINEEHPFVEVMPEYGDGKVSGEKKQKKSNKVQINK